eukprot:2313572-Pleurochrysis_carterae.AAC.2
MACVEFAGNDERHNSSRDLYLHIDIPACRETIISARKALRTLHEQSVTETTLRYGTATFANRAPSAPHCDSSHTHTTATKDPQQEVKSY